MAKNFTREIIKLRKSAPYTKTFYRRRFPSLCRSFRSAVRNLGESQHAKLIRGGQKSEETHRLVKGSGKLQALK